MEKWRQLLHMEPVDGWLNDPNGLCYFHQRYHAFFQYSPRSAKGETPRCWGHFVGRDLLHMEYKGIALRPSIPEDRDGVYSGCAIVHEDRLHIFYTGNVKEPGDYDYVNEGRGANVIHVISENGMDMGEKKVVLRNEDYPEYCSCHVRDPKVWKEGTLFKMVLGARTRDGEGCVLLYSSANLEQWTFEKKIVKDDFGYMWECPDYFEIDGQGYLGVSPQGLHHQKEQFQNVYQSGYFETQGEKCEQLTQFKEWDMGFDFYAPQTMLTPDGRRILIGWMGIGDIDYENPTVELGWQHCLTLPRVITADEEGALLQNPMEEMKNLRGPYRQLVGENRRPIYFPFDFYGKTNANFTIDIDQIMTLNYDQMEGIFSLSFQNQKPGGGRTTRYARLPKCSDIRIIADRSSLEIYLNGGSVVMSTRFYPDNLNAWVKVHGFTAEVWNLEKERKNEKYVAGNW